MVRAAAAFLIQLPETFKVQALNQSVNHPNWIMLCNILVNSLRKKHCLVGIIRTKMYLCHSENLMPKDTKSLGNNKAPACESRGFVLKKKKVRILTHLHFRREEFYFYSLRHAEWKSGRASYLYIKNPNRIPAATAEPITPATFGPIACINK